MDISVFDTAIPGQSLTDEPGGVPWEQPPMVTTPEDAIEYHMNELNSPDVMDNLLGMIDAGIPISVMVSTMLSSAVMNGIHSADVKMLINPLMFSHVKALATAAGIDFKETMADYEDKDEMARIKRQRNLAAKIEVKKKLSGKTMDRGDQIQQSVSEAMSEDTDVEMQNEEMPTGGLMSKEQM